MAHGRRFAIYGRSRGRPVMDARRRRRKACHLSFRRFIFITVLSLLLILALLVILLFLRWPRLLRHLCLRRNLFVLEYCPGVEGPAEPRSWWCEERGKTVLGRHCIACHYWIMQYTKARCNCARNLTVHTRMVNAIC